MREVGYAGLVEHHGLHAEVDEELHRLYRKFRDGDEGIARDVVEFLREWWFVHILQVDMAYNPTK